MSKKNRKREAVRGLLESNEPSVQRCVLTGIEGGERKEYEFLADQRGQRIIDHLSRQARRVSQLEHLLEQVMGGEENVREKWQPFEQCVARYHPVLGMREMEEGESMFANNLYTVVRKVDGEFGAVGVAFHLSIRRNDRRAVHDWRDMQRIKNELVGENEEAAEIYPDEKRLVDTANQYFLWGKFGMQLPFGFDVRVVCDESNAGAVQRKFRPEEKPSDCSEITEEELVKAHEDAMRSIAGFKPYRVANLKAVAVDTDGHVKDISKID